MKKVQKTKEGTGWEDIRYGGKLPGEILKELSEEVVEQYYLWDLILKREIELYPNLLFPMIREVFERDYPNGTEICFIATEYVVRRIHEEEGSTINSVYADIAVRIGARDIYHLECQMHRDKGMILRMLEYDIHIALTQEESAVPGRGGEELPEVVFPKSVILYLYPYKKLPSMEKCVIRFADGTHREFRVPVVRVQQYSLEMIEERHLNLLIPFLPIRFRAVLDQTGRGGKAVDREAVKKDLTEFIRQCIIVIEREKVNETLTDAAGRDLIELLSMSCAHLLKKEPELDEEVRRMLLPTIHLMRDDINQLENEKEQLRDEIAQLESEKGRLESEKGRLESEKGQLESENGRLESENERLESEKGRLESEKGRLESEKGRLESEKGQLESENGRLESENEQLRKRVEELERLNRGQ